MAATNANAINYFSPAKWVVSTVSGEGTSTTIAAALTAASSGDTIFIMPGTYTENLTLKAGVNLTAYGSDSSLNGTGVVIINGTCTLTTAGTVTISGIQLQTNSAALLIVSGSAASVVNLVDCYLNCSNNTGITYSSSSGSSAINIYRCSGNLGTTGIAYYTMTSTGLLYFQYCQLLNSGNSTTTNSNSNGEVLINYSTFESPISTSSIGEFSFTNSFFLTVNVAAITTAGTAISNCNYCYFSTGNASSISIGSGTGLVLSQCTVISTATNAITGAGGLSNYGTLFNNGSHLVNAVQTAGGAAAGLTQGSNPSPGFIGEQVRSAISNVSAVSITNNTAANITSISLTAGIWDVSCITAFQDSSAITGSFFEGSISTTTATRGILADASAFTPYPPLTNGIAVSVPSYRLTLSGTTTVFMVGFALFTVGTLTAYGRISATRVG